MTEAIEFEVADPGQPSLGDQGTAEESTDGFAPAAMPVVPAPGWSPDEAAKVVGGLVANVTLAIYVMRHQAPPPAALWPHIAGDPEREFPLLGAGLAPVLDFLAPKGSAAAVGVSLTAGLGELVGAFGRRAPILALPPDLRPASPPTSPPPAAAPRPSEEKGGFRFDAGALKVLERAGDDALVGTGIA